MVGSRFQCIGGLFVQWEKRSQGAGVRMSFVRLPLTGNFIAAFYLALKFCRPYTTIPRYSMHAVSGWVIERSICSEAAIASWLLRHPWYGLVVGTQVCFIGVVTPTIQIVNESRFRMMSEAVPGHGGCCVQVLSLGRCLSNKAVPPRPPVPPL